MATEIGMDQVQQPQGIAQGEDGYYTIPVQNYINAEDPAAGVIAMRAKINVPPQGIKDVNQIRGYFRSASEPKTVIPDIGFVNQVQVSNIRVDRDRLVVILTATNIAEMIYIHADFVDAVEINMPLSAEAVMQFKPGIRFNVTIEFLIPKEEEEASDVEKSETEQTDAEATKAPDPEGDPVENAVKEPQAVKALRATDPAE